MTIIACVAITYAGVQYFIARRLVVTSMKASGMTIEAVRIRTIVLSNTWWIAVYWEFRDKDEPGHRMVLSTSTAWLGLGPTTRGHGPYHMTP